MSKNQKIQCSICGEWFTRKGLPGHMRFKHGIESKRHKPVGQAQRPQARAREVIQEIGERVAQDMEAQNFSAREQKIIEAAADTATLQVARMLADAFGKKTDR